jgi:DNA-binding response OmpR family regulator
MKKLIYILEDDSTMRDVLARLLNEKFVVNAFPNVASFMNALEIQVPDIYLLDINLPDGNGLDLAELLVNSKDKHRPILVMSSHNQGVVAEKMHLLDGFIQKPFSCAALKQVINTVLFSR